MNEIIIIIINIITYMLGSDLFFVFKAIKNNYK